MWTGGYVSAAFDIIGIVIVAPITTRQVFLPTDRQTDRRSFARSFSAAANGSDLSSLVAVVEMSSCPATLRPVSSTTALTAAAAASIPPS